MEISEVRQLFPVTRNYNFQNSAAVAPVSTRVVDAVNTYLTRIRDQSYVDSGFYEHVGEVRKLAAQLLNADTEEVTFVKSTSEGISFVANGLNWSTGDNIVTANCEFPSNVYPWMALQARGVQLTTVVEEDGRIPLDRLASAIDSRTRLVAISAVQYGSGFRTKASLLAPAARAAVEAFPRQALHAAELGFRHPGRPEDLHFESPLPADLAALLEALEA